MPQPTDRVDPRCTRSRERVLAAAVALLREGGLAGLNFEAVAVRSGVARTTIYRHFADREALHAAAIESVGPTISMSCTDDVEADLVEFLRGLDRSLHDQQFGGVLLTGLDGAERSARMEEHVRFVAARRRAVLAQRLTIAQGVGELDIDADLDLVCSQLAGPLFYRRFISRQPTGRAFVAQLVSSVVTPLRPLPPGAAAASSGGGPR